MDILLNYIVPIGGSAILIGIAIAAVILYRRAARLTSKLEGQSRELPTIQRVSHIPGQSDEAENARTDELRQQTSLMRQYHDQGLDQCRMSFHFSLAFAALGFCVIIAAFVAMYFQEANNSSGLTEELDKQSLDIDKQLESNRDKDKVLFQETVEKQNDLTIVELEVQRLEREKVAADAAEHLLTTRYQGAITSFEQLKSEEAASTNGSLSLLSNRELEFKETIAIATSELKSPSYELTKIVSQLSEIRQVYFEREREVQRILTDCESGTKIVLKDEFADKSLEGTLLELKTSLATLIGDSTEVESAAGVAAMPAIDPESKEYLAFEIRHYQNTYFEALQILAAALRLRERCNVAMKGRTYLDEIRTIGSELSSLGKTAGELDSNLKNALLKQAKVANRLVTISLEKQQLEEARRALRADREELIKNHSEVLAQFRSKAPSFYTNATSMVGLLAGTIINAVAGLFFVQSNRTRRLMSEFFDRLRNDEKIFVAMGLVNSLKEKDAQTRLKCVLALSFSNVELSKDILESLMPKSIVKNP